MNLLHCQLDCSLGATTLNFGDISNVLQALLNHWNDDIVQDIDSGHMCRVALMACYIATDQTFLLGHQTVS